MTWKANVRKRFADGRWSDLKYCRGLQAIADECRFTSPAKIKKWIGDEKSGRITSPCGSFNIYIINRPEPQEIVRARKSAESVTSVRPEQEHRTKARRKSANKASQKHMRGFAVWRGISIAEFVVILVLLL